MPPEILCPTCPRCGAEPRLVIGGEQAFHDDDGECPAFVWDLTLTAEQNIAATTYICDRCGTELADVKTACPCRA